MNINTVFGKYLRGLRLNKQLTLSELAKCAKISIEYMSQIETGKRSPPQIEILSRIAKKLNVSIEEMKNMADRGRDKIELHISGVAETQIDFGLKLARSWDRLSVEEVERMMEVINNK